MNNNDYMYLSTSKMIFNALKNRVNGVVRTEFNTESDVLIVDIQFKDFKFRKLISKFGDYVYGGGIDELVTILIGTYRNQLLHAFFKDERAENTSDNEVDDFISYV